MTFLFIPIFFLVTSFASGYDVYVDKNYSGDNSDGSSEKPYKTIEKAIEESGSEDKIYIKNGTYSETITLQKEIELYGQSKDKTIIKGTIKSEGDNLIKNLTVIGKSYGIVSSGKIEIENCKIKNASRIAIDLSESEKEASITNSIISGNGKGIYVQRKRSIFISGNTITSNNEEGVDIREKVSGTISKNQISENGEGGIEIIVGGSDIEINGNSITKNSSSGIASQFYSFVEKTGSINIRNNTINKNGKYGLTCGIPSGGSPSGSYWSESIELKENTIENNKIEAVNDVCNIIRAVDEEEEKENTTSPDSETTLDIEEEIENNEIKEQIIRETILEQKNIDSILLSSADETINSLGKKNKIISFILGITNKDLGRLAEKQLEINKQAISLGDLLTETNDAENKDSIEKEIEKLKIKSESISNFKEEQKNKFSLWRWIKKLFGNS